MSQIRLVSHIGMPELEDQLEEQIQQISPDIECIRLAPDQAVDPRLQAEVLFTTAKATPNLAALLEPQHGIRWIHVLGTGVDMFPCELARGLMLTCSRGATGVPMAEWAMAMILSAEKSLPESWIKAPPARWYDANLASLQGKSLGVLGYGAIGQALVRRATAFDMQIYALVRTSRQSGSEEGVNFVENFKQLMAQSDHLVLAAPATEKTRYIVNADSLMSARAGLHIVNIARGTLINQDDLRSALDAGQVALASLDAVDPEPLPASHWMYSHPRVKLSPHISWSSPLASKNLVDLFLNNLQAFLHNTELEGVVNIDEGY